MITVQLDPVEAKLAARALEMVANATECRAELLNVARLLRIAAK